jgi:hypothetical protein
MSLNTSSNTNTNINVSSKKVKKTVSKKKQVSFSTQEVFDVGFKTDVEASFCNVSKMLFKNVINIDGSIDMEQLVNVRKRDLWAYIYYLYQYNNGTIPEFVKMKNLKTGKADGQLFHDVVFDETNINTNVKSKKNNIGTDIVKILYFINRVVHTYKKDLINPVIDYLNKLMKQEMYTKLSEIKVQMIPENGMFNRNNSKKNVRVGVELI